MGYCRYWWGKWPGGSSAPSNIKCNPWLLHFSFDLTSGRTSLRVVLCVCLAPVPYILLFSLLCVKLGVVGGTAFQFSSWILKQANSPTYLLCMATYLPSSFILFWCFFFCCCCCLFICFLLQLTPNLFLKQMLERYLKSDADNNNDKWMTEGVTQTWDNLMLQVIITLNTITNY